VDDCDLWSLVKHKLFRGAGVPPAIFPTSARCKKMPAGRQRHNPILAAFVTFVFFVVEVSEENSA